MLFIQKMKITEDDILYVFGRNVITGLPSERAVAKDTICRGN